MRATAILRVAPRQSAPFNQRTSFESIIAHGVGYPPEETTTHLPYGAEHMEPGVAYAPTGPASIARVRKMNPNCLSQGSVVGLTDKTVPWDLLDIKLCFKSLEPGNVVPQPYPDEIVEPVSADPERHPVAPLFWWHKWRPVDRPTSYNTAVEDVVTEGKDKNPWSQFRNPGIMNYRQKMIKKIGDFKGGGRWRKRMKFGGGRRKQNPKLSLCSRHGGNPWWVKADVATMKVEGRNEPDTSTYPHFAFYKYLPILGWNGWGTKQGEIVVEDRYTEVGLDQIQWWIDTGLLNPNETITPGVLVESRAVDDYHWPGLKLVSGGCTWFSAQVDIEMENADPDAIAAVEANGGTVVTQWRDNEAIVKEKSPWRFSVIQSPPTPPAELLRDVYANEDRRGYLSGFYQKVLQANPESPREWSLLRESPRSIGELPPEKVPQQARPLERRASQVSLQKKQEYWEDYLAGTANQPASRHGLMTPKPFPIWEYTYYKKRGVGQVRKREPPAGMEVVLFPGYPLRDSRYYDFVDHGRTQVKEEQMKRQQPDSAKEDPYAVTEMDVVTVKKKMSWELKGEGWRTAEDAEVRYRNPYNNPYLKERIAKWMKEEKRKKALAKEGKGGFKT
eukprot:TRINITY_DN11066_c0_g1_i1.p1 TRINITY_DN11066_c0_g1~~TRINITY_DN11066_c0_g1_i1.p1  ORF type:complete len:616 (+),score=167.20 TRINITY_DN11066_c0_g1_i1:159-2006(+)